MKIMLVYETEVEDSLIADSFDALLHAVNRMQNAIEKAVGCDDLADVFKEIKEDYERT